MKQYTRIYLDAGGAIRHVQTQDTPFPASHELLSETDGGGNPVPFQAREFVFDSGDAVQKHTRARELLDERLRCNGQKEVLCDGKQVLGPREGILETGPDGRVSSITGRDGTTRPYPNKDG